MGKVVKAVSNAVSSGAKAVGSAVSSTTKAVTSVVKPVAKATEKVVKETGKAVDKVVDKGIDIGKNIANSSIKSITDLAKGDVVGSLTNVANLGTGGTWDFTGRKQGVVNVNTKKYIAQAMGADIGASGTGSVVIPATYKSGKSGLVTQLRKGKGNVGGGSYSEIAKNPLGGTSGKTGK